MFSIMYFEVFNCFISSFSLFIFEFIPYWLSSSSSSLYNLSYIYFQIGFSINVNLSVNLNFTFDFKNNF